MTISLEQLQSLRDDRLVEKLALDVMRWHKLTPELSKRITATAWFNSEDRWMVNVRDWNPFENWSHTMDVVQQVRDIQDDTEGKSWFMLRNYCDMWWASFIEGGQEVEELNDAPRAIAIAALLYIAQ